MDGDDEELYDLRRIVHEHGWPDTQVTALRNTCLAAAGKETLSEDERAFAAAVAAALDGRSPGIVRAHMELLAASGLTGMSLRDDARR